MGRERQTDRDTKGVREQGEKGKANSLLSRESNKRLDSRTPRSSPEQKADASLTEPLRCPQNTLFLLSVS